MEPRERILQKASELFLQLGVRNVTMDLLATELGISKRTIYELFDDKDKLVIESIKYMLVEENKELIEIVKSSEHVIEALFLIMKRQKERRESFPKVFIEDIKKYFQTVNESFFSCAENLKEFSASYNLLVKGIKQGIFRSDLRIDLVDTFIHEVIGMMHNSSRILLLSPADSEVLHNIMLPYFIGISTPKGHKLIEDFFEKNDITGSNI